MKSEYVKRVCDLPKMYVDSDDDAVDETVCVCGSRRFCFEEVRFVGKNP